MHYIYGLFKIQIYYDFPIKIITIQIFFMLLISLKDEPKLNAAVNSSPSSWGKTWITMTQQSSTALSMERTSSSVWRTSGRPGKHQKVKKGKEPRNPFPGVAEFGLQVPWAGCAALRRVVLLFLPCTRPCALQLPFWGVDSQDFLRAAPSKLFLLHLSVATKGSVLVLFLCPRNVCKIQPNSRLLKHPVPDGAVMGW